VKAVVTGIDGKKGAEIDLPRQFSEAYRPDLINRAFLAQRSLYLQPKGNFLRAGFQNTAEYYGRRHRSRQIINTGRSRLPREKITGYGTGRVMIVPHARGGHRAHPPKVVKTIIEKINFKEKQKAVRSAIAATADPKLVRERNHFFEGRLPLIVDSAFEGVTRVKDAKSALEKLGVEEDLQRARAGRKKRSGRGRLRKGGYKTPRSALIVYGEDHGVWRATRNIPGVNCVKVSDLTVEDLAPGGVAGRLTVWTGHAVEALKKDGLFE